MQCDYCGQEVLGHPVAVEISNEDLSPDTDLVAGDLNFCCQECFHAYMEEAGVPLDAQGDDEFDELEDDVPFSDRMRLTF